MTIRTIQPMYARSSSTVVFCHVLNTYAFHTLSSIFVALFHNAVKDKRSEKQGENLIYDGGDIYAWTRVKGSRWTGASVVDHVMLPALQLE